MEKIEILKMDKTQAVIVNETETTDHIDATPLAPAKQTLLQGLRANTRLALWGILLTSVSINYGYEITLVGGITTVPAFTRVFGIPTPAGYDEDSSDSDSGAYVDPYFITAAWIALWAVSHPIGSAIGSYLGGITQDRIGRKWTLMIGTVWQTVAIIICYFADQAQTVDARGGVYFVGKFVQGIGIGAVMATAHTYISEVLPPSIKGCITSLIAPFYLLGQVFGAIAVKVANGATPTDPAAIPNPMAYRKTIAGQWITSLLPLIVCLFLPESPLYSIRKNRLEVAQKACRRLQGPPRTPEDDIYPRLQQLVHEESQTKSETRPRYRDLFSTKSNTRRTLIILFIMAVQHFLGLTILGHANIIAVSIGMQAGKAATFVIIGAVLGLIGSLLAFFLLDKAGRRPILLYSAGFITIAWLAVGIAGCFQGDIKQQPAPKAVQNFCVAMFMLTIFALSLGAWPVSYAIGGETSSLELRAKSAAVAWAANAIIGAIVSLVAPYLYNKDQAHLGGKIGFIFFALSLVTYIISLLFVPESKGKDVEAMNRLYQGSVIVFRGGRKNVQSA